MGISDRTNSAGAAALATFFSDVPVHRIDLKGRGMLHLKSGCSMCGDDHLLVGGEVGRSVWILVV